MPISLSAKKSLRKSLKNRKENVSFKNKFKSIVKGYLTKPTKDSLEKVYSILDKLGNKNIFHKNKISRLKSKYAKSMDKPQVKIVKKAPVKKKANKTTKKSSKKMAK